MQRERGLARVSHKALPTCLTGPENACLEYFHLPIEGRFQASRTRPGRLAKSTAEETKKQPPGNTSFSKNASHRSAAIRMAARVGRP